MNRLITFLLFLLGSLSQSMQAQNDIINGVPWYDSEGNIINSHGSGIIKDNGRYWLFGEYKSDTSNAFPGFGCYSSKDLVHWRFDRIVLPVQPDGLMGPNRVGERVKVLRCPKTGKYVMFMHSDDMKYNDPHTSIAIADSVNGDYRFLGPIAYKGNPIRKWDIGVFQDDDGMAYLLIDHGPIYRLSDDYLCAEYLLPNPPAGSGESPAMMKYHGIYYIMYSNLTSWERNDNYYYTASSIEGPWNKRGLFCPEGTLTYNSQCTYILPLTIGNDTTFMYMGDRWSYPHQASCATQVWLPLTVEGTQLSIPEYWNMWNPRKVRATAMKGKNVDISFDSNVSGDSAILSFRGRQIVLYGHTDCHGGYAQLIIRNEKGGEVLSTLIDCYSLVADDGIRFVSPMLPKGRYTLTLRVSGEHPVWYSKARNRFGSDDYFVHFSHAKIR